MPDDVPRSVPGNLTAGANAARGPDLLDQAYEFRAAFGAWPQTWVEFHHGLAHLARATAAEKLRLADAVMAHKQKAQDFAQWRRDHRTLAGG